MQSMFDATIKLIMYTIFYAAEELKKITPNENDELILLMHNMSGRLAGMSCNRGSLSSQNSSRE